jgi:hypothetical protein
VCGRNFLIHLITVLKSFTCRHTNVALLQTYGSNAWRIHNYLLEATTKRAEKASEDLKQLTVEVNRARKNSQVCVKLPLPLLLFTLSSSRLISEISSTPWRRDGQSLFPAYYRLKWQMLPSMQKLSDSIRRRQSWPICRLILKLISTTVFD